jgi:hypothetical protein
MDQFGSTSLCNSLAQSDLNILLAVDLASGVTSFTDDVETALTNALNAVFSFCGDQTRTRRLLERQLENNFWLGEVSVTGLDSRTFPQCTSNVATRSSSLAFAHTDLFYFTCF